MALRALLIVSTLDGSGPGRVMAVLAGGLLEAGAQPLLLSTHGPSDSSLISETRSAGVTVKNLSMKSIGDARGAFRLMSLLRSWRPNVVHTRTIRADLLGRIGAAYGVPVINNIVNIYPDDCLARQGPVLGRAVMGAARATNSATRLFIANAHAVAANTVEAFGVPADCVRVVHDGLPLDGWRRPARADLRSVGVGPSATVCLTVARLHSQKGLEDLVVAAAKVVPNRPEVHFVIAGDGPERPSLEERIRSYGLESHVHLLGNREDVPNLMARADCFVLPSLFEGLPSAIIEAMAAGRAVIATAIAGVPELVEDGITGWLVPPAAPEALAERLLDALSRPLESMGKMGQRRAEENFSADIMTKHFLGVYDEVTRDA